MSRNLVELRRRTGSARATAPAVNGCASGNRATSRVCSILTGMCSALLMSLFLAGCAGFPFGRATPEWLMVPPVSTDRYLYFVGEGAVPGGGLAEAEHAAAVSLAAKVMDAVGITVQTDVAGPMESEVQRLRSSVMHQVLRQGGAHVNGLRIVDRYITRNGGAVTVNVLARYDRAAVVAEQNRVAALLAKQATAAENTENQADTLASRNDLYGAATKYIEAASSAMISPTPAASRLFEHNAEKATDAISRLHLVQLNDDLRGMVGTPFPDSFRMRIDAETSSGERVPVAGAQVRVGYVTIDDTGAKVDHTVVLRSSRDGVVAFNHPVPVVVGNATVQMDLDLNGYLALLDNAPQKFSATVDALKAAARREQVTFSYSVVSRATLTPIGVLVLDTDRAGNPTGTTDTSAGIRQQLSTDGFTVPSLRIDPSGLQGRSESELLSLLRANISSSTIRVAFGTSQIEDFEESNGYIVKVGGTVKVVDLASGRLVYSNTLSTRSHGSSSASTITAAFRSLGKLFANDMALRLP